MAMQTSVQLTATSVMTSTKQLVSKAEIAAWLISYLSEMLAVNATEIDVQVPFEYYGLDSSAAIGLTGDLENFLEYEVEATIVYDYCTIETLSEHLAAVINA
jgi:acyl carrier protein